MNKQEFRSLIREEIKSVLKENEHKAIWDKLDPDTREDILLGYVKDPSQAEKMVMLSFDRLPDYVSGNLDFLRTVKGYKNKINESMATEIAAIILIPALFSGMTAGAIHTIAGVVDAISWGSDKVSDLVYDAQAWWKDHKDNQPINAIIKRIKKDPEVQDFIKNPNKKGWQKMLASKLTPEEQQYITKLYKARFK
jgi:hypothetical protein